MFKRRLAVLAAVATLAVTGLAGSALADEPVRPTAGTKVICKTSDGRTIEIVRARSMEGVKPARPDGEIRKTKPMKGFEATRPDGEIRKAKPAETVVLREGDPAAEVKALPLPAEKAEALTRVEEGDAVRSPAEPGTVRDHADKGWAKTLKIQCEKAE
ncbi:hypothetical protein E1295_13970 [Nonomuraea mesophila]|uniref:Uncharacterized protein n=1 Tax=Nonomuraea mesophila TaxID=2530382 RepID=A0A4R5FS99_9ACTN|nr:hypothetical protein [Nonomuraea mesophila]TDE55643.1 hypothetical protein E1295_13970 [Nonomuraea mesophila]